MHTLIGPLINLLILIALLTYYCREPMKSFARTRSITIRDELARVREQLGQARTRHSEFSSKLKAMDAEIAALKNQALQDAQAMRTRIMAESQKISANISSDARNAAVTLYSEFKSQIYGEVGNRVLDRAEEILRERLTGDDRARICQEFSHQIQAARG